jgi:glucuronate isomerase
MPEVIILEDQHSRTTGTNVRYLQTYFNMSSTRQTILQALRDTRLVDPHSHINPHSPASTTLADILGYHYYTELVHSAGTPKHHIESSELSPRELVERLVPGLRHLTNTAQHAWLIDICQRFFGFEEEVIDESNWESLYDAAESTMRLADWSDVVLQKSNVEAVFLTNDFDDNLAGFDTNTYIPCLRTDDLVFHLSKVEVRDRLAVCTGIDLEGSLKSVRDSLEQRFEHFVAHGARACAISLPPDFTPAPVSDGRAATALDAILRLGPAADASHKSAMARRVFWTIVELCDQYQLPMDLMIGVNRGVYAEGVHQGRDLYDSRVSLIQYRELFNTFPSVKFPISVLASVTNQELVSYAWIFPNVLTNGHWWYSNTPSFIRRDAAARLEAVPRNKQIGYYSDAYKLEFIAPKFEMYRNILSSILMDDFVIARGWSEEKAIELGQQILRGNVDSIFPDRSASLDANSPSYADQAESFANDPGIAIPGLATAGLASVAVEAWQNEESDEVLSAAQEGAELDAVDEADEAGVDELPITDVEESLAFESASEEAADIDNTEAFDEHSTAPEEAEIDLNATIEEVDPQWLATEPIKNTSDSSSEEALPEEDLSEQAAELDTWEPELDAPAPANDSEVASDPHATLQMDPSWLDEVIDTGSPDRAQEDNLSLDAPLVDDQPFDMDSASSDEFLELDLEESAEDASMPEEPSGNDIRYFRADETVDVDESFEADAFVDDELITNDNSSGSIYADPATGELTMAVPTNDADEELDETYLLSDEPEPEAGDLNLATLDEVIDFDDLELTPMSDDDTDSLMFAEEDEASSEEQPTQPSAEPDATIAFDDDIDFTFDEPEEESKP